MNNLINLQSNIGARKRKKTVGRGNGSGHGTYATRGGKGQTARTGSGYKPGFEGGQTPLYRKMPKLKGFNNVNHIDYQPVNVGSLSVFDENEEVDALKLYAHSLIRSKYKPVKILGEGELTKKLIVKAEKFSTSAKEKIEKAKGTAEVIKPKVAPTPANTKKIEKK